MKNIDIVPENDKRKYFRIDDMAFLSYRVVSWAEVRDSKKPESSKLESSKQLTKLTCKANLDRLSRELQPLYNVIKTSNSNVANYLSMLDKKITLLSDCLIDVEEFEVSVKPQKINISGGGLSFVSDKAIAIGAMLELTMKLMPEDAVVHSYANVITCIEADSSTEENDSMQREYKIGVEFESMDDDVRDIITRHVFVREQRLLNKD